MADELIVLPPSVESLLHEISSEQSQPLPDTPARSKLASLGEEASLRILSQIRTTRIKTSFDGFIFYLANNEYRSPNSHPGSPAPTVVSLPGSVEELIGSICKEQSQPPLGENVKRKLALVGEEEALRLLWIVRKSRISQSFEGYVMYLMKNDSPSPVSLKQESIYSSPSRPASSSSITSPNFLDRVTYSLQDRLTLSPISAATLSGGSESPCQANNVASPSGQSFSSSRIDGIPSLQTFSPSTKVWSPIGQTSSPVSQASNAQDLVSSTQNRKPSGQTSAAVLHALHQLEFRKAFLILSYIGRNNLEEVTSIEELKDLAAVHSMGAFEDRIWDRFGSRYCQEEDRLKQVDWESGRRYYYYHCYVCFDGSYSLKGPYLNKTGTLLQKILGEENVLMVKFDDVDNSRKNYGLPISYTAYRKVAEQGICVGLKRFEFFVFKDGGKEEKQKSSSGAVKSYFVNKDSFDRFYENEDSFFDMMSMHDLRCLFMHVHNLSSLSAYMARFSLILSKTITLDVNLNDPDVHVEVIDDILCTDVNGLPIYDKDGKLQIHTDGTGYISEELALRCPRNCFKGNDQFFERYLETVQPGTTIGQFKPDVMQPPLLIQFRMFHKGRAVKGTALVNKKLQGKRIQIRPSMIKVEPDPGLSCIPSVNSFEIVNTSIRPRKTRLSRNLIALLNYGNVPRDFFVGILVNEIWDAHNIFTYKRAALKVAINYGKMDDNYTVARMILSGIPLDESYIQWKLPILGKVELRNLKEGKLPIPDSFYVMGTTDPTGYLNSNEVCIIHETGQFEGDVLVYRTPGLHFGDVHRLKATRIKGLEDIIGGSKYGILFPTNGPRSLADKMAGGDFDGDLYFVSKHPELLKYFSQSEPWTPAPLSSQSTAVKRKLSEFTANELEHELFQLFLTTRFQPSASPGMAANSWLAYMDEMLSLCDQQKDKKLDLQNKMLRLVDIYYEALDAPKKGQKVDLPRNLVSQRFPHFMNNGKCKNKSTYKSTSVLGEIFDKPDKLQLQPPAVQVWKLPRFDIEVPLQCIISWEEHYERYRIEMRDALSKNESVKDAASSNVIETYKQILYGADEFEDSPRSWKEIRFDALAIYHVVYNYAMQKKEANKCAFAWRVAGPALMKIYIEKQDEKTIDSLPSVLREIM